MKNLIKIITTVLIGFTVVSCVNTDDGSADMNGNPNNPELPTNVSYTCQVKAIVDANCVGCHSKYSTYSGVTSDISEILKVIALPNNNVEVMPRSGRMPQYNIDMLYKWQSQGLVNAGTCSTGGGTGAKVSYATDIKPLITTTCQGCHGPGTSRPKAYNNYDQVKAAFAEIKKNTDNNFMPQGAPWSSTQKALFLQWQTDGYQQ